MVRKRSYELKDRFQPLIDFYERQSYENLQVRNIYVKKYILPKLSIRRIDDILRICYSIGLLDMYSAYPCKVYIYKSVAHAKQTVRDMPPSQKPLYQCRVIPDAIQFLIGWLKEHASNEFICIEWMIKQLLPFKAFRKRVFIIIDALLSIQAIRIVNHKVKWILIPTENIDPKPQLNLLPIQKCPLLIDCFDTNGILI